jgi:tetratricopeptide (TPR) repeat protein
MDTLRETIHSLSKEERREFRAFINRQRLRQNRKDLALFDLMLEDEELKPREIVSRFYEDGNMNAYHTLRKRLTQHLQDFISLKIKHEDDSAYAHISGLISISRYLLSKNRPEVAAKFLDKAEKLAENNEVYELLDAIYNLEIIHAHRLEKPVSELIEKWKYSRDQREIEEKISMAYGLIRSRLERMKHDGTDENLEMITGQALRELDVEQAALTRPSLMYMIVAMTRSALIATKSYHQFEPYVIDAYNRILKSQGFQKKDHLYELWFLYMISHVLYRNRQFDKCKEYLEALNDAISRYGNLHVNMFYPRYVLLTAAMLSYSGRNDKAINMLESALEEPSFKPDLTNRLNLILNLAVYHFQAEDYKMANQTLLKIQHTDKWCEKKMGMEWRFKKNLIEIIIQIELGNSEIALTRIKSMERYFSTFFQKLLYQRAKTFIRFIRFVVEKPEQVKSEAFALQVDEMIDRLPGDREDIQAMTFFCWLKSKMLGKPYYPVLIQTIKEFGS